MKFAVWVLLCFSGFWRTKESREVVPSNYFSFWGKLKVKSYIRCRIVLTTAPTNTLPSEPFRGLSNFSVIYEWYIVIEDYSWTSAASCGFKYVQTNVPGSKGSEPWRSKGQVLKIKIKKIFLRISNGNVSINGMNLHFDSIFMLA